MHVLRLAHVSNNYGGLNHFQSNTIRKISSKIWPNSWKEGWEPD